MKEFKTILVVCISLLLISCNGNKPTAEEVKLKWGQFEKGQTIKYRLVDLQKTPVFKKISTDGKFNDEYKYLEQVDIYSIVHLSDGLYVTGLIAAPKEGGKYPCIIFNRGGNRDLGSLIVATAVDFMAPLAAKGYVVIASNYRGSPGCEGLDEFGGNDVNDVINLANSLSELPQVDTSRVGLFGISRGGMMSYIALSKSSRFKTAAVVGAISNLFQLKKDRPEFETEVFKELIPNYENEKEAQLKSRSAVYFAENRLKNKPILLLHGENDDKVSVKHSLELDSVLTKHNYPHKLVIFKNEEHGLIGSKNESMLEIVNWFNSYLKPEDATITRK